LTINWKDNSGNETGFQIEQSLSSTTGFSLINTVAPNSISVNINSLLPNTKYYYRLRAVNLVGNSTYTPTLATTTLALTPPQPPSNIFVSNISTNSVMLSWKDNSNNESGFQIERSVVSGSGFSLASSLGPNSTTYSSTNLLPKTKYYYRMRAFNEDGFSPYSPEISITTSAIPLPVSPSNLKLVSPDTSQVLLVWDDNSKNEKGFYIERSLYPDSSYVVIGKSEANMNKYLDKTQLKQKLYYRIKAYNESGNSLASNTALITIDNNSERRYWKNLIALYDFNEGRGNSIMDISGYKTPLPLQIKDTLYTTWPNDGGLLVKSGAVIKSLTTAFKITEACKASGEITIELFINKNSTSSLSSTLYTLEKSDQIRSFFLENSYNETNKKALFNFGFSTSGTLTNGFPLMSEYVSPRSDAVDHIVYTRNKVGYEKLILNNVILRNSYRTGSINAWNNYGNLLLANDINETTPWEGRLFLFAIYNEALTDSIIKENYALGLSLNNNSSKVANLEVDCFPNPTYGSSNIKLTTLNKDTEVQNVLLQIYNSEGVVLFSQNIFKISDTFEYEYNFSDLVPGVYFVKVVTKNQSISKKLVVLNYLPQELSK
jgi:hypothetical protein